MRTGGGGYHISAKVRIQIFLTEHLVHKLLTVVTKYPVLLKISVLNSRLYLR